MDDEVGAKLQRLLQDRRQEGVVGDHQGARRLGPRRHLLQVGDPQERIARRFDQHDFRRLGKGLVALGRIGQIGEFHPEMPEIGPFPQQSVGAAVAIMGGQHQIAGPEVRQGQIEGRQAGGGDDGVMPALQIGNDLAQAVTGRIAASGIIINPAIAERVKGKIARGDQRRCDRAMGRILVDAGPGGYGPAT